MFFGLSHVEVPVKSLEDARALYRDVMGFTEARSGPGWCDMHCNSASLRLVEVAQPRCSVNLRVQVADVEGAYALLRDRGLRPMYEPMRTPELELVASLEDSSGHHVTVWRPLTEDEYGFQPELPKTGRWSAEAEALLKALLADVPSLFRGLARRKVTRWAEDLAGESGETVTSRTVVRAYILSSARVTRGRVVAPLKKQGFNPDDFRAEFDAD